MGHTAGGTIVVREEACERWELTPEKIELIQGKLFWSEEERLNMLGMLLENVGVDKVVSLIDPKVWHAAVMKNIVMKINAKVLKVGTEVFESEEAFLRWVNHPCRALGGVTPLSLLESEDGKQKVLDELMRIEYCIYS